MAASAKKKVGAVAVMGGGIGGIQASLDLANSGFKVYLIEGSSTIGGTMAQLDKTFPTNDCSMCILSPKLVECGRHLNIEVITNAEIDKVDGEPGSFNLTLLRAPRYVDPEKCTGCGVCAEHCPVGALDSYNEGLQRRKAIYIRYPQAVPLAYSIDRDTCVGCGVCERVCLAQAVRYDDKGEKETLSVGAVLLAPGFEEFDARLRPEYGYKRYPNVLTSIEFERILGASGPFLGHVLRPSDGRIPRKIAFVSCVGSRDPKVGRGYCSSVCCMYSTKEALIAKEHMEGIEPTIFFMDMRSYGKEFDKYIERAEKEYGLRYVRSRISHLEEVPNTHNLRVRYELNGTLASDEFELVVLSVGLDLPSRAKELAARLGIELNEYGFAKTHPFSPLETSRPGIFVGGAFQGPKDIPETVAQASGVAAQASSLLSSERGTLVKAKEYPAPIDVTNERPRIGAFICHCGINIGAYVDVGAVVEYVRSLPNVVYAEENLYTCSQDTQEKIKEMIREHNLNRVIVAACTPRTHEPLFQDTIREVGLNPYLFEMANIRDQNSWVHMKQPEEATRKAKDLVRMAVEKARLISPLTTTTLDIVKRGLVVGGGIAGMTAALRLAEEGYETYLLEREPELGGMARGIYHTMEGEDVQAFLKELADKVRNNDRLTVLTGIEIEKIDGFVGNFKTTIRTGIRHPLDFARDRQATGISPRKPAPKTQERQEIEHGVVIVATGAKEYEPKEYLYGEDDKVITQRELEKRLSTSNSELSSLNSVVMIQCVGSRNEEHNYCSRVCCSEAVKNAIRVKELDAKTDVYVLYRDMRTYGFREDYYQRARELGVAFLRFEEGEEPEVKKNGKGLEVLIGDPVLGEKLLLEPDLLVLSVGTVPHADNREMAKFLKVPLNEDGFFLEAHMKLRPVDFATEGVFLCGLAHSPKFIEESISQANAAVSRACTILSQDKIETQGSVSQVDDLKCNGCSLCVDVCPYKAIELVERRVLGIQKVVAQVNGALCKGCGACCASCRSGSIDLRGFTDDQICSQIRGFAEVVEATS